MTIQFNYANSSPTLILDFANSQQLDPRITFTRASTGTYYDGKTVIKAEENLTTQSNTLSTWSAGSNIARTLFANTAPDNTKSASLYTTTAGGVVAGGVYWTSTLSSSTYTFSIFAKSAGQNFLQLLWSGAASTDYANFDLATGTLTGGTYAKASIKNAANGWYRCSITSTNLVSGSYIAYTWLPTANNSPRANTSIGDGVKGILLWGGQLEQRDNVSGYLATTTSANTTYVPALVTAANNIPRFDNNPITGESLGLLIEEQRTNIALNSDNFTAWGNSAGGLFNTNVYYAPDGTLSADVVYSTGGGIFQIYTVSAATTYTESIYVKYISGNGTAFRFGNDQSPNNCTTTFNLLTGSVVSNQANVTSSSITFAGNGWYRCSITYTSTGTVSSMVAYNANPNSQWALWGAQHEAGDFPTSYIPTAATTVTRNADLANMSGTNFSSWYNANEGTVYFESKSIQGTNSYPFSLFGTNTSNRIFANYNTLSTMLSGTRINGTFEAAVTTPSNTALTNTFGKGATAYKVNDFGFSWNGATALTDTSTALPAVIQLNIGNNGALTSNWLNGTIKKLAYYPVRLTDAQIKTLTEL